MLINTAIDYADSTFEGDDPVSWRWTNLWGAGRRASFPNADPSSLLGGPLTRKIAFSYINDFDPTHRGLVKGTDVQSETRTMLRRVLLVMLDLGDLSVR
jgi:hypothetical protein